MAVGHGAADANWIEELSDEECMEVFWLYVDPPEPFLAAHPAPLLGAAMRHALRLVMAEHPDPAHLNPPPGR